MRTPKEDAMNPHRALVTVAASIAVSVGAAVVWTDPVIRAALIGWATYQALILALAVRRLERERR
jgi:hypothetical protein